MTSPTYDRIILAACQATYLPEELGFRACADLDGAEARRFLESAGFIVVSNRDCGTHGEAVTAEGIKLSTNGYCYQ